MTPEPRHLVVIGQGAAGLAAALTAAEDARTRLLPIRVTLIDKAPETEAGGNTRWSPSNMRMAAPDRMEPSFVRDMLEATQGRGDAAYFTRLAEDAPATAAWLMSRGVEFIQPPYYLAKGPPRIQPVGNGAALINTLVRAARNIGVVFQYGCTAQTIVVERERITGVTVRQNGAITTLAADGVVLACGGFQGNGPMMGHFFGPGGEAMRLISPGTGYDTGDGIAMALALGADRDGDWNGMHAEPVDARSKNSAPVVLVYPYGVVVDKTGRRFFDEGGGLMHQTWEKLARDIPSLPGSIAYAILDSRLFDIADYQRAIRSDVPPFRADTLAELARLIEVNADGLAATVATYNAACTGDSKMFDATCCDGLAAEPGLTPPKSNWARAISVSPYLAYPLIGAVAYTFGGIATDVRARVLRGGAPVPGLYAAGEVTGHFHGTAPNAVAILRALVFGRIAGREAVQELSATV